LSGWRLRSCGIIASLAAGALLVGCGAGPRQDASEPKGNFPVSASASWSTSQHLAQHSQLVIKATNTGNKTVPDIAVTICNVTCSYSASALNNGEGTSVEAFAYKLNMPNLANSSRPVWVVDQAPGPRGAPCPSVNANGEPNGSYDNNYSACTGGQGGAVTAYDNTWALGSLAPGQTATFDWHLTAVQSGTHVVRWEIAAGLNGKAKAVGPSGSQPGGSITVNVAQAPQQSYVNNKGQVVTTP
jgi:hypothetical protein